jgi:hypothetical protein
MDQLRLLASGPARAVDVFIPGHPPTPNDRAHYWQVAKDRAKWKAIAFKACGPAATELEAPVDVELTFVYGVDRARDPDNQIASAKPLLDGLVLARVITDDSNRVIRRLSVATEVRRSTIEGVRIRVAEVRS